MRRNILNDLYATARRVPDKTAFSDGETSLTFREVLDLARGLGSFLCRRGIYRRPVVVFMRKSPQEAAAFLPRRIHPGNGQNLPPGGRRDRPLPGRRRNSGGRRSFTGGL